MDKSLEIDDLAKQSLKSLQEQKQRFHDELYEKSKHLNKFVETVLKKTDRASEDSDSRAFAQGYEYRLKELAAAT